VKQRHSLGAVSCRKFGWFKGLNSYLYRSNELVSTAWQRLDVARGLGRIAERVANARNCVVKAVVEIDEGVSRPDFSPKFFASHNLAGTLQQRGQHQQGLALQAQLYAAFTQLSGAEIQLKMSKRSTGAVWTGADMLEFFKT
jgi:hypothetical protein